MTDAFFVFSQSFGANVGTALQIRRFLASSYIQIKCSWPSYHGVSGSIVG
jgi:hypothetical protein